MNNEVISSAINTIQMRIALLEAEYYSAIRKNEIFENLKRIFLEIKRLKQEIICVDESIMDTTILCG